MTIALITLPVLSFVFGLLIGGMAAGAKLEDTRNDAFYAASRSYEAKLQAALIANATLRGQLADARRQRSVCIPDWAEGDA